MRSPLACATICAMTLGWAWPAAALAQDDPPEHVLSEEREVALALSAAPPAVAKAASVYVLRPHGFVKAREGTNGYACIVARGGDSRDQIPICHNREGSETVLPVVFHKAELRARGVPTEDIEREIQEGYRSGRYRAPRPGGISYMLSTEAFGYTEQGDRFTVDPHVMVYAPQATAEDLGYDAALTGEMSEAGLPFIFADAEPIRYIVIYKRDWSGSESFGTENAEKKR